MRRFAIIWDFDGSGSGSSFDFNLRLVGRIQAEGFALFVG